MGGVTEMRLRRRFQARGRPPGKSCQIALKKKIPPPANGVQFPEPQVIDFIGAWGRTRTGTGRTPRDFKSLASTRSATQAGE
jgi:hypothetical protein